MKLWPLFSRKSNEDGSARHSLDLFRMLGGWGSTSAGVDVTLEVALQVTTVLACARVIAEGLAQVPCKVHREVGRDKTVARKHPLHKLLHRKPNGWQTSFEFRENMALHCVLAGDGVAFVNRDMRGSPIELIPIKPGDVTFKQQDDYSIKYKITAPSGKSQEFPQSAIWHWRGPSWDGVAGLNALKTTRNAIGLAVAAEESQAKMHRNGLRASGLYSMDGTLGEKGYKELRAFLDQEYGGAENAGKTLILDRGAKFLNMQQTGVDAQHLETRRYQVEEICRSLRVLPIMIGYSDKAATYASAEQMFLAHLVHTLAPWYERIEQSADVQLLTDDEMDDGYYVKFNAAGMMRGALKDTSEYLTKLTAAGIMTRNEARDKLELNPLEGLDEPLTPTTATKPDEEPDEDEGRPPTKPDEDEDQQPAPGKKPTEGVKP